MKFYFLKKFKYQVIEDIDEKSEQLKNEIQNVLNKNQFQFTGTDISLSHSVKYQFKIFWCKFFKLKSKDQTRIRNKRKIVCT